MSILKKSKTTLSGMYCAIVIVMILPLNGFANVETPVSIGVSSTYLIKTVVALCFVLLVIFMLSRLVRSFNSSGKLNKGPIRVLAGTTIGNRERLVIVQAGDTQLLLGVGPAGIVKLEKFDRPVITDDTDAGSSFRDQLQNIIGNQVR